MPITERILHRLPGPRWAGIAGWAIAVLATPLVVSGGERLSGVAVSDPWGELPSQAVLVYVVALLLYGVARIVDGAVALAPDVALLTINEAERSATPRRDLVGPLVLSAVVVVVAGGRSWIANGAVPTVVVLPFLALTAVPVMTFVWTYVRLLIGLDRLGRSRLALQPFPEDPSLGLGAVGSLAFTGFALIAAASVPTLLATTNSVTTFAMTLAVLAANVPIFFWSMWRLHHQMSGARSRYVAEARALYVAAYEPLRSDRRLAVLREQAPVLQAAQALEARAERIQVWPIEDWLIAIVGFVVAGVASGVIVRFIAIALAL